MTDSASFGDYLNPDWNADFGFESSDPIFNFGADFFADAPSYEQLEGYSNALIPSTSSPEKIGDAVRDSFFAHRTAKGSQERAGKNTSPCLQKQETQTDEPATAEYLPQYLSALTIADESHRASTSNHTTSAATIHSNPSTMSSTGEASFKNNNNMPSTLDNTSSIKEVEGMEPDNHSHGPDQFGFGELYPRFSETKRYAFEYVLDDGPMSLEDNARLDEALAALAAARNSGQLTLTSEQLSDTIKQLTSTILSESSKREPNGHQATREPIVPTARCKKCITGLKAARSPETTSLKLRWISRLA